MKNFSHFVGLFIVAIIIVGLIALITAPLSFIDGCTNNGYDGATLSEGLWYCTKNPNGDPLLILYEVATTSLFKSIEVKVK